MSGDQALSEAIAAVVAKHGGVRATARATGVDVGYISRLMLGSKTSPGEDTLRKLGLTEIRLYMEFVADQEPLGPEFEAVWDANREKLYES